MVLKKMHTHIYITIPNYANQEYLKREYLAEATILKVFIMVFFLAVPRGLWDLSSRTTDRTQALAVNAPSPNHWTTREILNVFIF